MTQTFKVGDKVQYLNTTSSRDYSEGGTNRCKVGQTYEVEMVVPGCLYLKGVPDGHLIGGFELVSSEPTDAELATAYRAAGAENRRLFNELTKRGYTVEAMFEGSRRKLRTADSDTRYITKSEIKRVEL